MKRILLILMLVFLPTVSVNAQEIGCIHEVIIENNSVNEDEISPKADIMQWRYKIVDQRLYKRLYNTSTGEWVGDWILCT